MTKPFRLTLLAVLGLALVVAAACYPPVTPVPPAAPAPSNDITDIVWQWTSVSNKTTGEKTTVANPQVYTITFRDDGTLNGQADCNSFSGTYSQEGGFTITLGAMTMAACGENSMDQQYLQLLGSVVAGGPDGAGGLALETAGGEQRMEFVNGGPAASTAPACPRRPATSPTSSGSGKRWRMWRPARQPKYPIRTSTPLSSMTTGQRPGKLTAIRSPEPIRKGPTSRST